MTPTHLGPDDDDLGLERELTSDDHRNEHVYVRTSVEIKWWAMVVSVGASLASAALAIVMVVAVRSESRRVACASIVAQDETYREVPPSTPAGIANAKKMRELRESLGCSPHEGK